ncbi:prefoldin subunit 1-like [Actinia tenebrosa]|uniref:Prefoldin subunit 1-like n=1 Tax=Actinia tenebrosa TaxID=6105 RepID=A0A6P8H4F3_ACTTE|nr:prefoldin subunit 1-like [Actinia tenebrosa]
MATTFDSELRKAFQELQVKVIDTTQKVKIAEAQIDQLKRANQHATLTDQELSTLQEDTKTYESIGRMFVLQPISDVRTTISARVKANEEKIKNIEANKDYLQKSVKSHEDSIREMLMHRK